MKTRSYGFTSDELRQLADRIDSIVESLGKDEWEAGDWRWDTQIAIRDESDNVVGFLVAEDGVWFGMHFIGDSRSSRIAKRGFPWHEDGATRYMEED